MDPSNQQLLFSLLRSAICDTELTQQEKEALTSEVWIKLYTIAKQHDIAHLLAVAIRKNTLLVEGNVQKAIENEYSKAIFRYEQLNYELEEICKTFETAKIPFIPLKGSVIRNYYPEPWMRTSCDIDILVHEEDIERAIEALTAEGYENIKRNYHDVSLYSPSNIHLELHFNILENTPNLDVVLQNAWNYAVLKEGEYHYEFTNDFFLFHILAHASYHFLGGGCGIRPLIDLWIIKHKMRIDELCAEELLKQAEILQFSKEIIALSEVCFSKQPPNDFSDTLLEYIVQGGVYGSLENKITVQKTQTQSTFAYGIKRLFMPYSSMVILFPILKKLPFLLPFFWVIRMFKGLFKGRAKNVMNEIKTANGVTDEQIEQTKLIKSRLGL